MYWVRQKATCVNMSEEDKNYLMLNSSFLRKQSILTSTNVQAATQGTRKFVARYLENKEDFSLLSYMIYVFYESYMIMPWLSDVGSGPAFFVRIRPIFRKKTRPDFRAKKMRVRPNPSPSEWLDVLILPEVVQLCRAPEQDGQDYCGNEFYT